MLLGRRCADFDNVHKSSWFLFTMSIFSNRPRKEFSILNFNYSTFISSDIEIAVTKSQNVYFACVFAQIAR